MKNLWYNLLVLLLLLGCGTRPRLYPQVDSDVSLEEYRKYFEQTTGNYGSDNIPIYFGDTEALAVCEYWVDIVGIWHEMHIIVNKNEFKWLSTTWRRAIISHELVHCHLRVDYHTAMRTEVSNYILMAHYQPIDQELTEEQLEKSLKIWSNNIR